MEFASPSGHYTRWSFARHVIQAVKCNENDPSGRKRARPLTFAGMLAIALLGCSAVAPGGRDAPVDQDSVPVPAPPDEAIAVRAPLTAVERAEVRTLLDDAARAIQRDHLTYPASGSAWILYDRVLLLDPGNAEAITGLDRVVERYLEMTLEAAGQGRFSQAGALLDRARLVEPEHPGIEAVATQIALLADAERHRYPLDSRALSDRDPAVVGRLRQAGMASRGSGCRAEIVARNDAEGRWIYQQMSLAQGSERIRAELRIGAPPRVEVLCFPESGYEPGYPRGSEE
jgi:hypothetical protein